jgi:aminocarboxymuconate-semialdehyde decarboxylase
MYVDMHAHYVPPKVLSFIEHDPSPYGTKLIEATGGGCCVQFAYGLTIRPFFPELLDLEERWQEMDRQGVDRQILSIWTDLSGYGMSSEEGAGWHRLLNEIMCAEARQHSAQLSAFASVPLQDAERAASELEYGVRQCGAVGGVIAANVDGSNLGEAPLDEFWAAAVELAVPIFIHPTQPTPLPRTRNYGLNQIVQYTYDTTASVGSLIFSGVLDRFPDLTLILSHGGGYFPYQAVRPSGKRPTIAGQRLSLPHGRSRCPETAGAGWLYCRGDRTNRRRHRATLVQALTRQAGRDRDC